MLRLSTRDGSYKAPRVSNLLLARGGEILQWVGNKLLLLLIKRLDVHLEVVHALVALLQITHLVSHEVVRRLSGRTHLHLHAHWVAKLMTMGQLRKLLLLLLHLVVFDTGLIFRII